MTIRSTVIEHKQSFNLRTHEYKLSRLAGEFPSLISFLNKMHQACPDEPFFNGPRSSSIHAGPLPVYGDMTTHVRCEQTLQGLVVNADRFSERHEQVQFYMLEHDDCTVAMEVPLWVDFQEAGVFQSLMATDQFLSGHVDLLAIEDGRVWIWDYKPKAEKERWVHVQLSAYALMLSFRTGISLDNIRCGYFDEHLCRTFVPRQIHVDHFDFYSYVRPGHTRQTLLKQKPTKADMPTMVFNGQGHFTIDFPDAALDSSRRSTPIHRPGRSAADPFPEKQTLQIPKRPPARAKHTPRTPTPPSRTPSHDGLEWHDVVSEAIRRIAYLPSTEQLFVQFTCNNERYVYDHVSSHVFQSLLNSESIGRFFFHEIRMRYPYRRIA